MIFHTAHLQHTDKVSVFPQSIDKVMKRCEWGNEVAGSAEKANIYCEHLQSRRILQEIHL